MIVLNGSVKSLITLHFFLNSIVGIIINPSGHSPNENESTVFYRIQRTSELPSSVTQGCRNPDIRREERSINMEQVDVSPEEKK